MHRTAVKFKRVWPSGIAEAEKIRPGAKPHTEREVRRNSHPGKSDKTALTCAEIDSRATPPDVLQNMTVMADWLARTGWNLASGGADGADSAFARDCAGRPADALPALARL